MKKYILLVVFFYTSMLCGIEVVVVGCGYVGLTLAGILADAQHTITCIDIDADKIEALINKQLPIYEPGLYELLFSDTNTKRITFTHSFDTLPQAQLYYICVPTPVTIDGACDCSYVRAACATVLAMQATDDPVILVIKSTVVPGTIQLLQAEFGTGANNVHFVYNPEFMREGSALHDIRLRNPIILGGQSDYALQVVAQLLTSCLAAPTALIKTNLQTAELIKYAWNAFSAIRIAYVNELASACRLLGADIRQVVQGLALSEQLLPTTQLKPGPGYGGSCLPKDTIAFAHMLENIGFDATIIHRAIESNVQHKNRIVHAILDGLEAVRGPRTIALLGVAFKANTDDVRHSVALDIIPALQTHNVLVKVYDPRAMPALQALYADAVYCTSAYDAAENADCIVVLTEWPEFSMLDVSRLASLCRKKKIIDTRNLFNPADLYKHGFEYITMGTV